MEEFVPQRTSAYISQNDLHNGDMTVRETLDFSARCQGVGFRYDAIAELARREKLQAIKPDPDIDTFMKAATVEGQKTSIVTDYMLKFLGLDVCSDTMVGDNMRRGISGGQKKRVTTGEMIIGSSMAFFMDEISTGLDSSKIEYDKSECHPSALVRNKYGLSKIELFKACFDREILLMKRSAFIFIFKAIQIAMVALITMTVFLRTKMDHTSLVGGQKYMGVLFFGLVNNMFNGMAEAQMAIMRLPVFYKQRDAMFFPAWAYSLPTFISRIPISLIESSIWVILTYYTTGMAPSFERFLYQLLVMFNLHQMSLSLFRFIAALGRNMIVTNTFGAFVLLIIFVLGGFIVSREDIESWWLWWFGS